VVVGKDVEGALELVDALHDELHRLVSLLEHRQLEKHLQNKAGKDALLEKLAGDACAGTSRASSLVCGMDGVGLGDGEDVEITSPHLASAW
jgi:hypothetical protein